MYKAKWAQPHARPILKSEERLHFVRQVGRRRYYVDKKNPERGEFYVLEVSMPRAYEPSDAELVGPKLHAEHRKYPQYGPYWIDSNGRDVFLEGGKPFYVGMFKGEEHKIFLGVSQDDRVFRSRASVPSKAARSQGGTHRIGGHIGNS